MTDHTLNEAVAVIVDCRNFMAGMCYDPAIPAHAKDALSMKADDLDHYLLDHYFSEAQGEEDD